MCRPTNTSSLTSASFDNKSFRQIRQRNAAVGNTSATASSTAQAETRNVAAVANSDPETTFYAKLNDVVDSEPADSEHSDDSRKLRRAAARARLNRSPSRPDASGRINNKECHLFAFGALLEEELM